MRPPSRKSEVAECAPDHDLLELVLEQEPDRRQRRAPVVGELHRARVRERPEVRLYLDEWLSKLVCSTSDVVESERVGPVEADVDEDQVRDLILMVKRGIEGIDAAAEKATHGVVSLTGSDARRHVDWNGVVGLVPQTEDL